jgi:heme/copper-type cytochrome/quinol oxidase subunit 1
MQFADFNMVSSIGAFGFGLSQLVFLAVIVKCIKGGAEGAGQALGRREGLEWTLPSPAPYHSFETPPIVKCPTTHPHDPPLILDHRMTGPARHRNLRTALILLSIAAVFFAGVIVNRALFGS